MPPTKIITLLSDQVAVREQINSVCSKNQGAVYNVVLIDALEKAGDGEIMLIAEDKIHLLLSLDSSQMIPCPVIFLQRSTDKLLHDESQIKTHVHEIIDMDKITPAGFLRAITHAAEKFYLQNELYKQKAILSELTQSSGDESHPAHAPETGSTIQTTVESLIEENKKLTAIGISNIDNMAETAVKDLIEANKKLIEGIRKQTEELKTLARIDMLTKVGNRLNFEETLTTMIAHARRHKHMLALLMIDLDKFKNVNDTYGHQAGDQLLQQVAKRLQNMLRKDDFVARLGGDEFAVVLNEIKSFHTADAVSWKMIQQLKKPFEINNIAVSIDASIGIACYPLIGESVEDLLKNADIAMYQAKKSHTIKYAVASMDIQSNYLKKTGLENELRSAITHHELHMVYQPIYEIPSRQLHGFEALIRWENKVFGKISPVEFIPIAENIGLMRTINTWVLHTVCKQIAVWRAIYAFPYKISINLSLSQLVENELVDIVSDIIKIHKIPLQLIEFEITEVAAIQETQAASSTLQKLCDLGASHALDDFGTGSSIRHLQYLPVSTIKIDQSFVQGMGSRSTDEKIVSSIISLAKNMGLKVVAEGVETQEQLDALIKENCDYIQGFLFSKPLTALQAGELMEKK